MAQRSNSTKYDVVIVGSGIAGMLLAYELSQIGLRTALVCKSNLLDSNTAWAQGGVSICSNTNPLDDVEKHLSDTLSAGAGLCDERIARMIIEGGEKLLERFHQLGLNFDRAADGQLELAREGGHSQNRVLHVKDATGRAIAETLLRAVRSCKRVQIYERVFAFDLLMSNDRCVGLKALKNGSPIEILAPHVVMASGGLGQVFDRTTNPHVATGDGIAMAYRAGARLVDMEFVQFHPTALYIPGAPASLITEAVRGAGAHLLDGRGERFAFRFHPSGELATRDVVSRAIQTVMLEQCTPCVYLDLRPIGAADILQKFPNIVKTCRNWGIDPLETAIPVSPAAHYFMGGVWTDEHACTSIPGLYAIGECASNGLHGANRLASNSLLEGGVMAMKLAELIAGQARIKQLGTPAGPTMESVILANDYCTPENIDVFRKNMFSLAGLCRDGGKLCDFNIEYNSASPHAVPMEEKALEAANIGLLGNLIVQAALKRCESRGSHFRVDCPYTDNRNYLSRFFMSIEGNGQIELPSAAEISISIIPVIETTRITKSA